MLSGMAASNRNLKYLRIAHELRRAIQLGGYEPGEPLPTEAALIARYHVSRTTIAKAMQLLIHEGLVITRHPRGRFVRNITTLTDQPLASGETVAARMPDRTERRDHALDPGIPLLVVTTPAGTVQTLPADRYRLVA
jgi:DNA-binding FadR family transcriptional regulator